MTQWRSIVRRLMPTSAWRSLLPLASLAVIVAFFGLAVLPTTTSTTPYDLRETASADVPDQWQLVELSATHSAQKSAESNQAAARSDRVNRSATSPVFVSSSDRAAVNRIAPESVVYVPAVRVAPRDPGKAKQIAELTATIDCVWASDTPVNEQESLVVGQSLKLKEGLAKVTFASGAKVILQGPARLQLLSENTAVLHAGRLTADVPDNVKDFRIITPTAQFRALPTDPSDPKSIELSPAKSASVSK